ncbi:MAG: hypothetical protein WKF94_04255 [Solirubrobacteraceae bacterium]
MAKGIKARVRFSSAGKVKLLARKGKRKVGAKSVSFKKAGGKKARIKLRVARLGRKRPVKVTVRASGRSRAGVRAPTVKKAKKLK